MRRYPVKHFGFRERLFPYRGQPVAVHQFGPHEHASAHRMAADGLLQSLRLDCLSLLNHCSEIVVGQGYPIRVFLGRLIQQILVYPIF